MKGVEIKNLSKKWKEFSLKDINLRINKAEYFLILGPTGAGKTLLLETIAGFYPPDEGEIWMDGKEITHLPPERRNIGFIYQDYSLFPHLSVSQNIEFGLEVRGFGAKKIEERTKQVVNLLQIAYLAERYPNKLSGGEQQKVAIARALVINPKVLLLDEPLSALDPKTQDRLRDELKHLNGKLGLPMIHVTHNRLEAMALGDRIGVLMGGKLQQVGTPQEIFDKPANEEIANFVGIDNIFEGESKVENGIARVDLGELEIEAITSKEGKVKICVRPEDITILKKGIRSSARNLFEGKIVRVSERYPLMKLSVDAGREFQALITKRSFSELNLKVGSRVCVSFKASSVHVL
jgi:molybdate/tungstate transport system ATP-binding protein